MMDKVGNEKKADMAGAGMTGGNSGPSKDKAPGGAQGSSIVGNASLSHAVGHLYKEHPHAHDSLGPHHGTSDHKVMSPLGGLRPGKR